MQQETQVEQLQAQLNALKIRVFDAEETLQNEVKRYTAFLQGLVNTLVVPGDANGQVTLEDITARAQQLVAHEAASKTAPIVEDEFEVVED